MKKSTLGIIYTVIIITILNLLINILLIYYIGILKKDDVHLCSTEMQGFNEKFEQFGYIKELSKEQLELILEVIYENNKYNPIVICVQFYEEEYNLETSEDLQKLKSQLKDNEKYKLKYEEYNEETGYLEKIQIDLLQIRE